MEMESRSLTSKYITIVNLKNPYHTSDPVANVVTAVFDVAVTLVIDSEKHFCGTEYINLW